MLISDGTALGGVFREFPDGEVISSLPIPLDAGIPDIVGAEPGPIFPCARYRYKP